ncbi:NAD(P)/FAD-dependent oxidoreductase [Candidatus Margulisiibacteriota bacterium]
MNFTVSLPFNHSDEELEKRIFKKLKTKDYRILKKSIDARKKNDIRIVYRISSDIEDPVKNIYLSIEKKRKKIVSRNYFPTIYIIGSGPAGLFCAYWLSLHGIPVTILEKGPPISQRVVDIARFFRYGELKEDSNVCCGAGGAGTFSDGKLYTRIDSPYIDFILDIFVRFGADPSIRYVNNPHLGSNGIRHCIKNFIYNSNISVKWNSSLSDITIKNGKISHIQIDDKKISCDEVFLATGHSARDVYSLLRGKNIAMEFKPFAVGLRIEHPREFINQSQYGEDYQNQYPGIDTAYYRLTCSQKDLSHDVYTFCMCPGGYILNSSTTEEGIVTNGMSNVQKNGHYSNSAVVGSISYEDCKQFGYEGMDAGLDFQKHLEKSFKDLVNKKGVHTIPGQRVVDFLEQKESTKLENSSCLTPVQPAPLYKHLPSSLYESLVKGILDFDKKIKGFATHPDARLYGIETRTSAPYRILRDDKTLTSPTLSNLYPIGEGAGWSGGIISSAVDGINAAEKYIKKFI